MDDFPIYPPRKVLSWTTDTPSYHPKSSLNENLRELRRLLGEVFSVEFDFNGEDTRSFCPTKTDENRLSGEDTPKFPNSLKLKDDSFSVSNENDITLLSKQDNLFVFRAPAIPAAHSIPAPA